ncbi:MAG: DMT family transporter [Lacisediminihabitans sp.]
MPPDLLELTHAVTLTPHAALGIPIALVGAIFLSLGAQFQHRGVTKVEAASHANKTSSALSVHQLLLLLSRPSWVIGTLLLGLAIVFQLTSLYFAPLIVVQPLGAVALVITAVVNARVSKVRLTLGAIRAIAFCVVGVALFVTIAAFTATSGPVNKSQLVVILILLGVVTLAFAVSFWFLRRRFQALIYIVGAGVLYGFVATLAKVVIDRINTLVLYGSDTGGFEWLTTICVVALLAATALGGYFVQSAYASGPPDLVIAGLTVIDPIVAVCIGVVVLQEAAQAPLWAIPAFIVAGVLAVYGVFQLAKQHPQARG